MKRVFAIITALILTACLCAGALGITKTEMPSKPKVGASTAKKSLKNYAKKVPKKKAAAAKKPAAPQKTAADVAAGKNLKTVARKYSRISEAKKGDVVFFGRYEQDGNTANGPEPIEWIVLWRFDDGVMFLGSRYGLDCKPYNTYKASVTWENCSLREWLNGYFLETAFYRCEMDLMNTFSDFPNPSNSKYGTYGGGNTDDAVILLNEMLAGSCFSSDASRLCVATKYAKQRGVEVYDTGYCWCWLSTPGDTSDSAAHIDRYGRVNLMGNAVNHTNVAVRPAIKIVNTNSVFYDLYDSLSEKQLSLFENAFNSDSDARKAEFVNSLSDYQLSLLGDVLDEYGGDDEDDEDDEIPALPAPVAPGDFTNAKPGDIITFGTYKGEPIEWYVFKNSSVDWSGDPGLELISVKALDMMRYDSVAERFHPVAGAEWGYREVFKWLNGDFYNEAFSETEKKRFCNMTTTFEHGVTLEYKVNLPASSQLEKEKQVKPDIMQCEPSEYVRSQYAEYINGGTVDWWMKGKPYAEDKNWTVNAAGSYESASGSQLRAVRPWIAISKKGDYSDVKPGDTVTFGRYKGENIKWYVFQNGYINWSDPSNPGLEMISVKALDVKRFDTASGTEWEKSEILKWLNGTFINEAFIETERQQIRQFYTDLEDKTKVQFKINLPASTQLEKEIQVKPDIMLCVPSDYVRERYPEYVSGGTVDWWIKWNPYAKDKSWTVSEGGYKTAAVGELMGVRPWIAIKRK